MPKWLVFVDSGITSTTITFVALTKYGTATDFVRKVNKKTSSFRKDLTKRLGQIFEDLKLHKGLYESSPVNSAVSNVSYA